MITDSDRIIISNIIRLRKIRGMTRQALEEGAGLSFGILAQIETLHKPAGKSIQQRIAAYLKIPITDLSAHFKNMEDPALDLYSKEVAYLADILQEAFHNDKKLFMSVKDTIEHLFPKQARKVALAKEKMKKITAKTSAEGSAA
ncbi:MAG: hypothetical protein AABY45_06340 [Deltaproteobacteria bacterium]